LDDACGLSGDDTPVAFSFPFFSYVTKKNS
jgi:hypothetical protein